MKKLLDFLIFSPLLTMGETSQPTAESVLAFERARFEATRTRNIAQLCRTLADDLTWVHSRGKKQNKAESIYYRETSKTSYKAITVEASSARLFGKLAVTTGLARYDAVSDGKAMPGRAYHTAVYLFQNNRCQVIARQATRIKPTDK